MSREERICWENINKQICVYFLLFDGMHGAAEGLSILQDIRDFRISWYLESISVWNLKSDQDKVAKRKEAMWCENWSLSRL